MKIEIRSADSGLGSGPIVTSYQEIHDELITEELGEAMSEAYREFVGTTKYRELCNPTKITMTVTFI